MKKALIFLSGFLVLMALSSSSIDPANPLVGRWQRHINGVTLLVNFRPDGSYDAFVSGKSYIVGRYYVRQDTIGITDGKCNPTYYGIYRMSFTVSDSVRFSAMEDTCQDRRKAMAILALGRVHHVKP